MGKGRRVISNRSERLLGSYSYGNSHERFDGGEQELGEDDVWSTVDDTVNGESGEWSPRSGFESFWSRRLAPRTEDHNRLQAGGLSLAFDDSGETAPSRVVHQVRGQQDSATIASANGRHVASAPMNVPDWSKIHRVDSILSFHDFDFNRHDYFPEMVPPHVYLACEHARAGKTATSSMCEGVGRTLKGRDMSRVRDAVWSQTGFNG